MKRLMPPLTLLAALMAGSSSLQISPKSDLPYVTLYGADSQIQDQRYLRMKDRESWETLWREHTAGTPIDLTKAPQIDFDRCSVIAIFEGATTNTSGVLHHELVEKGQSCVLRYRVLSFQSGERAVPTTPFGFFVIPKTNGPLILEENVQGLGDSKPRWKQRFRFES